MGKLKENALVIDPEKGFGFEHIDQEKLRGTKWFCDGRWVSIMVRHGDKLTELKVPQDMKEPPERLYRALHWEAIVKPLFSLESGLLEKIKIVLLFALLAVVAFFIYLLYSSVTGG